MLSALFWIIVTRFLLKFLCRKIVWEQLYLRNILERLEMSILSSSVCFWMLHRLWCKEQSDFHTIPTGNLLLWSVPENRVYRQGSCQRTAPWESMLRGPKTLFQNTWHSSQWRNRDWNLALAVGGSVCVGMGHRELGSQVSMAGFCNLSPSTKLMGGSP